MGYGKCVEVSLAAERLKTNVSLGGHVWNSRTGLPCADDGMVGGMPVSSAGQLPFGPKGAADGTSPCVSLSPDWGVGKRYLLGLCHPQPIAPSGLPSPENSLLSNLHPKSQTLSSPEHHQSHQQTSPSSLPPHDLFKFPGTEAPSPLQLLHR